jgi:hypothetical protein
MVSPSDIGKLLAAQTLAGECIRICKMTRPEALCAAIAQLTGVPVQTIDARAALAPSAFSAELLARAWASGPLIVLFDEVGHPELLEPLGATLKTLGLAKKAVFVATASERRDSSLRDLFALTVEAPLVIAAARPWWRFW